MKSEKAVNIVKFNAKTGRYRKMRKDIAKQLDEGIVIIDSRAREVMLIEDCCKVEIKAVTEE